MEKLFTKNITKKEVESVLAVLGIGVSLYLTYVKFASNPFLCGFGDCGTVQASAYSSILGIPVAVFGIVYYFILLILIQKQKRKWELYWLIWGILFSSYLTYIEVFVLKAICGWCVVSFGIIIITSVVHFTKRKILEEELKL